MDNTCVTKCMLFDSMAAEIVMQSATQVLNGSLDEVFLYNMCFPFNHK